MGSLKHCDDTKKRKKRKKTETKSDGTMIWGDW